jgi:hypothetical protein
MIFAEQIWAANHMTLVHLQQTEEGLELTTDVGDEATTVVLDDDAVRRLRLALTRYERGRRQ